LLLNAAVKLCPEGAKVEVAEWGDLPVFSEDLEMPSSL